MEDKIGTIIGVLFYGGIAALVGHSMFFSEPSDTASAEPESSTIQTVSSPVSDPVDIERDPEPEPDYEYDSSAYYEESEPDFSNYDYNPEYNAATDLDCYDIGYEHYVGYDDPNGLDGDGDGVACEGW